MNTTLGDYDDIVTRYTVGQWDDEPESSRFKAEIQFTDNSILAVKDYIFPTGRKYAYHWQDGEGNLIIRWDNAPHWRGVNTFPYHRHEEGALFPSAEMTLDEVMKYISIRLKEKENQEL